MKYYEIPLYWTSYYFHAANPNDLGEGWASESDLIQELNQSGFTEITKTQLPDQFADNYGYSGVRFFADTNYQNFTATGFKY